MPLCLERRSRLILLASFAVEIPLYMRGATATYLKIYFFALQQPYYQDHHTHDRSYTSTN